MTVNYYIGTKDKDTKDYKLTNYYFEQTITEEFAKEYPYGFTVTTGTGYYKHDSGEVVTEQTYIVTVVDTTTVNYNLIDILKEKLNQECIGVQVIIDNVIFM